MPTGYYYYYDEESPDVKQKIPDFPRGKEAIVGNIQKLNTVNTESQTYSKEIHIYNTIILKNFTNLYKVHPEMVLFVR